MRAGIWRWSSLRLPGPLLLAGRRLLAVIPIAFGTSLITFVMLEYVPGNAAEQLLGAEATVEQVAQLESKLSLDRPAWRRYTDWLLGVLRGDFGKSLASGQSVKAVLVERLPVTLELVALGLLLAVSLAIPLALVAGRRPNGIADRLSSIVTMSALCVPNYVLAPLLVLAFSVNVRVFPSSGYVQASESITGNLLSLALPSIAIGLPLFGLYARFLRSDLVDQMVGEAYVVTAFAKGLGRWHVLLRHGLRNSLFGLLTIVSLHFGTLLGSTVVIEQIFALPGIGQLLLQAFNTRDTPLIQAILLLVALMTVVSSLGADLLNSIFDPRVRAAGGRA